jgi:hypothetical protein
MSGMPLPFRLGVPVKLNGESGGTSRPLDSRQPAADN